MPMSSLEPPRCETKRGKRKNEPKLEVVKKLARRHGQKGSGIEGSFTLHLELFPLRPGLRDFQEAMIIK